MKKSLIALAVLAASGAAMAQSSVTLYGIADVWFGSVHTDTGTGLAGSDMRQTVLNSGSVNGSRWGLKGSEDLGGGLSANFDFQAGIRLDDGSGTSAAASAFSRQSWVGLSGGFGAVRFGRTTTPYDDVSGASDAALDSGFAPMNSVFRSTGYTARPNNTIYYQSPTMSGFSGALSYSLGENKTAAADAGSTVSMNLVYAAGPLGVQFGYQTEKANGAAETVKFTRLGATYAFGPATVKGTYGRTQNIAAFAGADATDWQLGVDYAVSPALLLTASIATSDDNATAGDDNRKGFGLGAKYTLSKRTFLYGGYESDTTDHVVGNDSKHSVFQLGMQHRF
jgi:predicted porin